MKGVKKWFIVFLISLGLFVPSLLISSDVNALKYELVQFPFAQPIYNDSGYFGGGFKLEWDSSSYLPSILSDSVHYYNFSNNLCNYGTIFSANQPIYELDDNFLRFKAVFPFYDLEHYTYSDSNSVCRSLIPFGQSPVPDSSYHDDSNYPYWFPYSGAYTVDTLTSSDGLNFVSRFSLSTLFSSVPSSSFGHLTYIEIPLGSPADSVGQLYDGRSVRFDTTLYFDSDSSPNSDFNLNSQFNVSLSAFSDGGSAGSSTCSYNLIDNRSDSSIAPYELSISCNWISDYDYELGHVSFYLVFSGDGSSRLWSYNIDDFVIKKFSAITDNDITPSDSSFTSVVVGGSLSSAPSSASSPDSSTSSDWFSSLVNLFQFNLLNPFSGLFALFTDSSHCVNIPIIAGMLNSTETQYCSWFPSSVRSVLTPVIGVSSIMLLFGFFVRWLGSSSGNMFEDQTTHKWGNTQIKKGGK